MNCRDLYEWEQSREAAQENYKATSVQMHPVTSAMLAKDLHLVWTFIVTCVSATREAGLVFSSVCLCVICLYVCVYVCLSAENLKNAKDVHYG